MAVDPQTGLLGAAAIAISALTKALIAERKKARRRGEPAPDSSLDEKVAWLITQTRDNMQEIASLNALMASHDRRSERIDRALNEHLIQSRQDSKLLLEIHGALQRQLPPTG